MLEKFIKGAIVKHFWWEEKNLVSTNQSCYYVLLSANVDVTIMYH